MSPGHRALFLDWGGTLALTRDNRTVVDVAGQPVLMPNVAETLARARLGFAACFVVTNQARIGRGEITEAGVVRRIVWADSELGQPFTDWRICPHPDGDSCACRKPRPGMFLDLARAHGIDLAASLHVGDSPKDRDAAAAAGLGAYAWAWDFFAWPAPLRRNVD